MFGKKVGEKIMKKYIFALLPVVAITFASCQKEVSVEKVPEGVERTVTFVTSNEAVTKTYLEEVAGNRVFRWYNGDRIKIYDGVTNQDMTSDYRYIQRFGVAVVLGLQFGAVTLQ